MTRHDDFDLPEWPRITRNEALRDQAPDTDPPEPAWARCSLGALINAETGRCGHKPGTCERSTPTSGLVRCGACGWDDHGELAIYDTPVGLLVSGDEGRPRGFCGECDEPLSSLTVEAVDA